MLNHVIIMQPSKCKPSIKFSYKISSLSKPYSKYLVVIFSIQHFMNDNAFQLSLLIVDWIEKHISTQIDWCNCIFRLTAFLVPEFLSNPIIKMTTKVMTKLIDQIAKRTADQCYNDQETQLNVLLIYLHYAHCGLECLMNSFNVPAQKIQKRKTKNKTKNR